VAMTIKTTMGDILVASRLINNTAKKSNQRDLIRAISADQTLIDSFIIHGQNVNFTGN